MMPISQQTRAPRLSRGRVAFAAALLLGTLVGPRAQAQGTLSGLGFGYPVGGTSTRGAATGGAFGEFDALSPLNPASLGGLQRTIITAQTEPEFRTLKFGAATEKSTAERVPLLMMVFPASSGVAFGLSATTFLDRSYSTLTTGAVTIEGQPVSVHDQTDVRGSMGDLQGAVGWRVNDRLRVGFAGHLYTGDNLVARYRKFDDTLSFGSVVDSSRVTYYGMAASFGGELQLVKGLALSGSYRVGGNLESRVRDTVKTQGKVPNRLGLALRYDGVAGATFAVGMEKQSWSRMTGLGSAQVQARDATNYHAGAELVGPKIRGYPLMLRVGYANNQLPFGVDGKTVAESRVTGGVGVPLARDFATIDLSLQRANRTLTGGAAKESAWLLGVGIQIRP
jgi:hypothetical protein